jgi:hypothetical protein
MAISLPDNCSDENSKIDWAEIHWMDGSTKMKGRQTSEAEGGSIDSGAGETRRDRYRNLFCFQILVVLPWVREVDSSVEASDYAFCTTA